MTLACVFAVFAWWFVSRARAGARARAAAGVRLSVVERFAALDARVAKRAGFGALAGVVIAGAGGTAAGALAGVASVRFEEARRRRRATDQVGSQLPDVVRTVAAALRAGRNLPQAIEVARDEAGPPIRTALDAAVAHLAIGDTIEGALASFASQAGVASASVVADTIVVGRAAGANLPRILDVIVSSMTERDRIARDRRAATAQARMSATVVAIMPVAFFAIVGSGARDQLHLLFGDPIGWALLGAGVALEAGGALWMRALVRG